MLRIGVSDLMDKILYFAYGSNMRLRRLCASDRTPSAAVLATGYVRGRKLTFDKVSSDGSGKCDIEITDNLNEIVYGVLYEIPKMEKPALDKAEALGKGYREENITVVTPSGNYEALVYVATIKDPTLRPYHWYKALVLTGAIEHNLPEAYVKQIEAVDSIPDRDKERCMRNIKVVS